MQISKRNETSHEDVNLVLCEFGIVGKDQQCHRSSDLVVVLQLME